MPSSDGQWLTLVLPETGHRAFCSTGLKLASAGLVGLASGLQERRCAYCHRVNLGSHDSSPLHSLQIKNKTNPMQLNLS